ncbi:hypothetical protein Pla123a_32100 [Posidoniimonas polymericola]|uniref:3-keto-alpha-glucoside-1,2-lyase/3-keto-2-hydroxy-glucal hydratase domain-containing protein n=1 Tax=Posidoniimonas polymericola TaxID=2528002 RepID=A0A5C5YLC6_9BACT|nr:DUF1080 domain-containing protein [Posidoniimonas polymericola]TWT75700.1 hypothetical protein Pla123a_32100 [Posidoniimonas polymericola]
MNANSRSYFVATFVAALLASSPSGAGAAEEGFEPIFDGSTLKSWDGNPKLWRVADGVIVGETSDESPLESNEFLIWSGEADDFVLRLEFRIADRGVGNSGVQYRSKRLEDAGRWVVGGYQADIERTNKYMGILYEEQGRGILALRGEEVLLGGSANGVQRQVVGSVGNAEEIVNDVRAGEWQELEIVAQGNRLEHKINGRTTVLVVDKDESNAANSGILALQLHRGDEMMIEFKNIRLKKIAEGKEASE